MEVERRRAGVRCVRTTRTFRDINIIGEIEVVQECSRKYLLPVRPVEHDLLTSERASRLMDH